MVGFSAGIPVTLLCGAPLLSIPGLCIRMCRDLGFVALDKIDGSLEPWSRQMDNLQLSGGQVSVCLLRVSGIAMLRLLDNMPVSIASGACCRRLIDTCFRLSAITTNKNRAVVDRDIAQGRPQEGSSRTQYTFAHRGVVCKNNHSQQSPQFRPEPANHGQL